MKFVRFLTKFICFFFISILMLIISVLTIKVWFAIDMSALKSERQVTIQQIILHDSMDEKVF